MHSGARIDDLYDAVVKNGTQVISRQKAESFRSLNSKKKTREKRARERVASCGPKP